MPSFAPSVVLGHVGFSTACTLFGLAWCDGLVLVTSRINEPPTDRRPVPWQAGHVALLPPKEFVMRPSPLFAAAGSDGDVVLNALLEEKPVVLYFFPRALTPG